jgi:hypothetical protein
VSAPDLIIGVPTGTPGWLSARRRRVAVESMLLLLAAVTVAVSLEAPASTARLLLVLAAACLLPGGAVLTRLPVGEALEALGLAVALSLCVETIGVLAMIWTGWWHPVGFGVALAALSCLALAADLARTVHPSGKSAAR